MIPAWRDYLRTRGAEPAEGQIEHFGNDERERRASLSGDVMCDLSHYRLLVFQGTDARSFLQGQLTNDIEDLSPTRSQLSGFCTPKGRLISNFRLFQHGESVFAIIPDDTFDLTIEKLKHFIVSADVQMGDASTALIHIGVSGQRAEACLAEKLGSLPSETDDLFHHDQYIVIKTNTHRYEICGNLEDMTKLWEHLDVHATAVGNACWNLLNIRDGIPEITAGTSEQFVPQMVNMDLLGGIDFEKGCYTGQEIVARTHYLGKQKRRMYRLEVRSDRAPIPGDELKTPTSGEKQYTGTLITVEPEGGGNYHALSVVQISSAESGELMLREGDSEITLLELPYSLSAQPD